MYQIAIDGPAGTGKSTVSKLVASKLNFVYVDTGAIYRGLSVYIIEKNIDINNNTNFSQFLSTVNVNINYIDGNQHIIVNGLDVTSRLRTEEVGNMASVISAIDIVRKSLLDLQRSIADSNNVVMDGRDIGSVILPNATLKIYLTASSEVRARRRFDELSARGLLNLDLDKIKLEIEQRDYRDMNRQISPLIQVEDAKLIDTSNLTIDEVTDLIVGYFNDSI